METANASKPAASKMMNGSGCVFDHFGKIPEGVYTSASFQSPLEEAVFNNDIQRFDELTKESHPLSVQLKIGEMTCLEYAAMMGYHEILELLLKRSSNYKIIQEYFNLADIVEKAYMISFNKSFFFEQDGLMEINRYEAALFTAIEYNNPQCVEVILNHGLREPGKHCFKTNKTGTDYEKMSANQLAKIRGHSKCLEVLERRLPHLK